MTPLRIALALAVSSSLSANALSQNREKLNLDSHYAGFWMGQSLHTLGSVEIKTIFGVTHAYGRPWHMMSNWLKHDTQMVYEGYAQYSADNGDLGNEINSTGTFGALAYARWFDHRVFYDVGWGINYSTDTTRDLPSSINSTPVFGIGLREKRVDKELLYGVRFLHISNANQRSRNPGSNQLLIYVQVRSF